MSENIEEIIKEYNLFIRKGFLYKKTEGSRNKK